MLPDTGQTHNKNMQFCVIIRNQCLVKSTFQPWNMVLVKKLGREPLVRV